MSNESTVGIDSERKNKIQWGKGLFYRKEGDKFILRSKRITIGIILAFAMTTLLTVFMDTSKPTEDVRTVDTPHDLGNGSSEIALEKVSRASEEKSYNDGQMAMAINQKKRKVPRIARLSVIKRDDLDKIPMGSEVKAKLITGATNGPVKAKLLEPLVVNGTTYLPQDSILMGRGASTEERLIIQFSKLVFPNGSNIDIRSQAYDLSDKILGLKGSKVGRIAAKLAANTGLNFIGGVTQGLQESEVKDGVAIKKANMKNALLNGATYAALEQSKEMMEDLKDRQTVIEVKAGTEILIVFGGD